MNKKIIIILVVLLVAVGSLIFLSFTMQRVENGDAESINNESAREQERLEEEGINEEDGDYLVKEFVMESYTEVIDGRFFPSFSLKEISVNKGDTVRIKITTTSGSHDFKIDEFDVYAETPINREVIVEFVADKTGEFIYYCSKPNHRDLGHWGTLIVLE